MDKDEFKCYRQKLKKTQKQMADLLGVSIKAVHSYEQGWRPVPPAVERQFFFLLSRCKTGRKSSADCWNLKKCPQHRRENCPAWEFKSGAMCWYINGTFCKGIVQKNWKDKMAVCRSCRIFKKLLRV